MEIQKKAKVLFPKVADSNSCSDFSIVLLLLKRGIGIIAQGL